MTDTKELDIRYYSDKEYDTWDNFLIDAVNSSFICTRKFLAYHRDRFLDRSLMIYDSKQSLIALLPAAPNPENEKELVSHPGISYGGLIHKASLKGSEILSVLTNIAEFYKSEGYAKLLYKAMPHIYHKKPCEDSLYAMFRLGANRYRCDLTASIFLESRGKISERRRRGLKKAKRANLTVHANNDFLPEFWNILIENLSERHSAKPVHSIDEIMHLARIFDGDIKLVSAWDNDLMVAGVVLFETDTVSHAQYISSSRRGFELSALDFVINECIDTATLNGKRYFDFGISNECSGMVLNEGLYKYKTEFGAGGIIHEFYELNL